MARFDEWETDDLYAIAARWRDESLVHGTSLLWPDEKVWTPEVLGRFKACFVDKPDETEESFEQKFKRQLADQGAAVTKLACDLLLLHFLFSSNIRGETKRVLIRTVAGWQGLVLDERAPALAMLDRGIGGAGQAYNTRRPFELAFVARAAIALVDTDPADRTAILSDHRRLATLLEDVEGDATFPSRHVLLHLLYPDQYERIASGGHKQMIADAFAGFAEAAGDQVDVDERLHVIRRALQDLLPGESLDFYRPPLRDCWYDAGEARELSPIQGLEVKRQIVLYGPPGTGKTYQAKALAATLVRQAVLRAWGPKRYFQDPATVERLVSARVRRVQLHPGYGYEDLVRGLHLVEGGRVAYRNGVLLGLIADLASQPADVRDLPFVVILDEMNRADLSKVLGECFSLLEDRDGTVQLAGQDECPCLVRMPPSLHFIGTMNLIDQSLEQVDFALRRRFLWFFRGFEREDFLAVARFRWDAMHAAGRMPRRWDRFETEFELLAERAAAVNRLIEGHHALGRNYQVGHTYFCDVVAFARGDLTAKPGRQGLLFTKKGEARGPVEALWRYSLRPLLEQYLSGSDESERERFLRDARAALTAAKT